MRRPDWYRVAGFGLVVFGSLGLWLGILAFLQALRLT